MCILMLSFAQCAMEIVSQLQQVLYQQKAWESMRWVGSCTGTRQLSRLKGNEKEEKLVV